MIQKKIKKTKDKALEARKEYEKKLYDIAWSRIRSSTIPELVKLAMLMANSLSMLTERIDVMIRAEIRAMGLSCKSSNADGDIIKGLKNYSEKANAAMYWFGRDLQHFIDDSTFGSYGADAFDKFNHSSAEVIQLLMLIVDRGGRDDGMEKIFRALHRLKKGTRFSDEDIAKFDFNE